MSEAEASSSTDPSTETPEIGPVQEKVNKAKGLKDTADQAFRNGDVRSALLSYHQALMFLLGLDKNALQSIGMGGNPASSDAAKDGKDAKQKTEVDDIVEKIYANMSACHLKNENWKRAVETADKAIAKNENNYKALFRKAKGLGQLGFFEKAVKILEDVKTKNPTDVTLCEQEIARLQAIDNEREKAHKQKLKGFLNKEKAKAVLAEASS